jgi:tripartite-type tricarboxylate transporter receptor subunit TctC
MAARNLQELVAWLKENPGKATVGIGGVGGGADVVGTYFQKSTGTQFQFVPYRGAAPMMQDLLAGHIDLTFTHARLAPESYIPCWFLALSAFQNRGSVAHGKPS